jgi:hypothetical protein
MQGCGFPLIQLAARLFHPVLGNRRDIFRPFFVSSYNFWPLTRKARPSLINNDPLIIFIWGPHERLYGVHVTLRRGGFIVGFHLGGGY